MKISRIFVNKEALIRLLTGDDAKINHPLGYSYCDEEKGLSCSVFIGTKKETGELSLTPGGDIVFNIKTLQARKKGDHVANTEQPEVSADAQEDEAPAPQKSQEELWNEKLNEQLPL